MKRVLSRASILRWVSAVLWVVPGGAVFGADGALKGTAAEPAVMMRPFKVIAEWMDIRPLRRNGVIESVAIARVSPGCPADVAGICTGMRVVEIQGINVVGMAEEDFLGRLRSLPPANTLTLKFAAITRQNPLVYIVPLGLNPGNLIERIKLLKIDAEIEQISVDEVRSRLVRATAVFAKEVDRVLSKIPSGGPIGGFGGEFGGFSGGFSTVNVTNGAVAQMVPYELRRQVGEEFARIPAEHLPLLCEAAVVKKSDQSGRAALKPVLVNAIIGRADYRPEQKAVIVQYLPLLPDLIVTLKNMNWFEGTEATVAAGWATLRRENEGRSDHESRCARYVTLAAPRGLRDALIEVARMVDDREDSILRAFSARGAESILKEARDILERVVPLDNATPAARAKYVLKNKSRLVFDAQAKVYVVKNKS